MKILKKIVGLVFLPLKNKRKLQQPGRTDDPGETNPPKIDDPQTEPVKIDDPNKNPGQGDPPRNNIK